MVFFDETIEDLRDFNDSFRVLVNLATVIGTLLIIVYSVKFIAATFKALRLYVSSQLCCKTNLRKRYGEWVVISGSTDGIGLAMARDFARRGFSIIVIGRNEEKLSRTKLSLAAEANVGQVITIKIDLSDSSIENFEQIRAQIDPENRDIGILVNNAGMAAPKFARFHHSDMETLRDMANVNMLATIYFTRMIIPGMIERGKGLVLNVSSIGGYVPLLYGAIYGSTKAFINSFSRTLQLEYASDPVDIINLTPGYVKTSLLDGITTITKSSIIIPSAADFAKSALNAVSTRYLCFSGTFFHELFLMNAQFANFIGLLPIATRAMFKYFGKNYALSPMMVRKKPPQQIEKSVPR